MSDSESDISADIARAPEAAVAPQDGKGDAYEYWMQRLGKNDKNEDHDDSDISESEETKEDQKK